MKKYFKISIFCFIATVFFILSLGISCKKDKPLQGTVAELSTNEVMGTLASALSGGGTLINDGGNAITQTGMVWSSMTETPTLENNEGKSTDGTLSGSYSSNFSNLIANTTYYVRAYASNAKGTGYGESLCFVIDINNNAYRTVKIDNQVWMKENLKTLTLNTGEQLNYVSSTASWTNIVLTTPIVCYYDNDPANFQTYGVLYNWPCIATGKLAPKGWHVPNESELIVLYNFLGGKTEAGGMLKDNTPLADGGTWADPNTGATNQSGFSALPGGIRNDIGSFSTLGSYAYFWTTKTEAGSDDATYFSLDKDTKALTVSNAPKKCGFSVRCVKDSQVL